MYVLYIVGVFNIRGDIYVCFVYCWWGGGCLIGTR